VRLETPPEPITDDDAAIRAALEDVELVPLLVSVAQVTGDRTILRPHLRPDPANFLLPDVGYTPEQLAEARDLAAAALAAWRDRGALPAPTATDAEIRELIDWLSGGTLTDEYLPLAREELAIDGEDLRAPTWTKDGVAPGTPFTVAIVGAGMSGIAVAHRLQQAGVPFVILEKNADVGGTWFENTYPGCRVDVPNHFYSYSFAQTGEWPQFFSTQEALLDYFRACVDHFGLREHIRFGTEVLGADFDDAEQVWRVRTRDADGGEHVDTYQALVSAVGQLNRPSFPDIAGRDRYAGTWFHSARWDHGVDLAGRRVGIIGTGASAAQFIPHVAEQAAELTIFQRTPPWLIPTPNYQDDLPDGMRWLLRHVPAYARWDRLWLFWRTQEGLLPMAEVDDEWPDKSKSVSMMNEFVRQMFSAYFAEQFTDPALLEKVHPQYPPLSKRFVRDNGIWARTLTRPNVELVTDTIEEITEKGIRTVDGREHEFDVLIYGTGFQASKFLTPMQVRGVDGVDLHERWAGDARAYLGLTVPGFPNLFLMYGPNTNIVVNGSIIYFSECEARYIVESVRMLLEGGKRSMDCKPEVHDAYNERIDAANLKRAWGAATVHSWYKNAKGRVSQNWPFALLEYWQQTRTPDPDDYVLR
jgi:4-hydroxyacetophenone monooxygenase